MRHVFFKDSHKISEDLHPSGPCLIAVYSTEVEMEVPVS